MSIHPEILLISAVIKTEEYQVLATKGITSAFFHVCMDEWDWIEKYIQRNSKTPSKTAFRQTFPAFTIYKVDDTEHWCDEVRKSHTRQSLVDIMENSLVLLDAGDESAALANLMIGGNRVQVEQGGVNSDFDVFEDWEQVYDSVSARVDRVRTKGWAGVPSGFSTFDHLTGGWQAGWLGIMAARLGQGKTWTGVRMAYAGAITGHKVAYYSLEQSRFQIASRVHAFGSRQYAKAPFNPMDLNKGTGFDLRDYKKFLQEMREKKGSGRFWINDTSRGIVTPSVIGAGVEAKQPDIVFIDYLTLLGATSDDWRGTAKLSSELQNIANRYGIPIVAMSQVNRLGISKEPPGAEHLSQADAIGQDADVVLTMTQKSQGVMKMRLAKFRHGPGGATWHAKFSPGTGEYEEVTETEAETLLAADNEED